MWNRSETVAQKKSFIRRSQEREIVADPKLECLSKHFEQRARAPVAAGGRLPQILFALVARHLIGRICHQA
jgi:hypothetical protein